MSDIPFAVRRRRLGYLITVLIPFGWLFVLGGLQRLRKAIVLGIVLYFVMGIPSSVLSGASESYDGVVGWIISLVGVGMFVAHLLIWWIFYNKWVAEWENGSNTSSEKQENQKS
jgi:L-lactate permease